MKLRSFGILCSAVLLAACNSAAQPAEGDHWVATWATSMLQTNIPAAPPAGRGAGAPPQAGGRGGPGRGGPGRGAPGRGGGRGFGPAIRSFDNQTVRMVVNTSIGGRSVRVHLSNVFGTQGVKIGAAHIALHDKDAAIIPASDRTLTFSGNPAATILPGASLISDPVDLAVPALGDLVVSVFFPEDSGPPTNHSTGLHSTYISAPGDFTGQTQFMAASTTNSWYFLSSVDVLAPASAAAIVAFGDSITDGVGTQNNSNGDWPSMLAKRLQASGIKNLAVVNQGISGNQVLRDGAGVSALARFERDVISQPGVKYVMFLEAINDIGTRAGPNAQAGDSFSAADIIAGYKQIVERAHDHGIKVIGCTLTPYEGASYSSEKGEAIREAVNDWIRTSGTLDGMADFEAAVRDPNNPKRYRSDLTRDNLHSNEAGYKAMADSVDLSVFGVK
jgi:lysophospholipase L1-like esterase